MTSVGLCGCGNMGGAIAHRLGPVFPLRVSDVDEARARQVADAAGAGVAPDLAALARSDVVVLSLPTQAVSAAVVTELLTYAGQGTAIVETSTVTPAHVRTLGERAAAVGVSLIDAAILSSPAHMRAGTTTLLLGGDDATLTPLRPVLDALAPHQLRLGPLGAGMAAKIGNNAVSHAVMVVLLEAAALMESEGVATSVFADLLAGPDSGLIRPLTHRVRERVRDGDYSAGMPTEAARKDSLLALELAAAGRVPLFAVQAAHTVYELAVAAGYARDDYAAIARLWETWTGRPFR